jgi:hypothetical protein
MPYRNVMGGIAAAMVLSVAPGDRVKAQDLSKYPDWSGQWKMTVSPTSQVALGVNWDPDKGSGLAQQAPLTPEYQARYEANLKDQAAGGQGDERHSYCIPLGMPRLMTVVYPMEIVIMPKTTYVLTDNSEPRRIFTDEREWPTEIEPSFNGLSIGKWIDADADGRYSTLKSRRVASRARAPLMRAASACTTTMRPSSRSASISTLPTGMFLSTRSPRSTMR